MLPIVFSLHCSIGLHANAHYMTIMYNTVESYPLIDHMDSFIELFLA